MDQAATMETRVKMTKRQFQMLLSCVIAGQLRPIGYYSEFRDLASSALIGMVSENEFDHYLKDIAGGKVSY